jgi:2-polyprenyl-3-methyl-5-hydroxy-6-metoxy-1,4-benzoquinol methylase
MNHMSSVEETLAQSLTAETTELLPYLPYLLQDLWELGSVPMDMVELISGNVGVSPRTKILDLACGKGAVSVRLAEEYGCSVKGIDIIPEFIAYAEKKAAEHSVDSLCHFEVGDVNRSIEWERNYDIVILGAVGDVLGDALETISKLKNTIGPQGYLVIDDAYRADSPEGKYLSREQYLKIFEGARVKVVAERRADHADLIAINRSNQARIVLRAHELKAMHPEKSSIFDGYIRSQQAECDELEGETTGVTWLLQAVSTESA